MNKSAKKHDIAAFFGKRILLLIPHADDESVMCAGAISRARKRGCVIYTMVLTTGCVDDELISNSKKSDHAARIQQRKEEFQEVVDCLGLKVLAYNKRPGRCIYQQMDKIWPEVKAAIDKYSIDQLWVPAFEGGHPDHDATNGMVSIMLKEISILEFPAYHFADKKIITNAFIIPSGQDQVVLLTAEERMLKKTCMGIYASEKRNLKYFRTIQEMFRPLPKYNYKKMPHALPLWYMRYQWVPTWINKVDICRVQPTQVSDAIEAFKKKMTPALAPTVPSTMSALT